MFSVSPGPFPDFVAASPLSGEFARNVLDYNVAASSHFNARRRGSSEQ